MPQCMRCNSLVDPCFGDPLVEAALDLASSNPIPQLAEEERLTFDEDLLAFFKIEMEDGSRLCIEKSVDNLSAFSPDCDPLPQQIDVADIEVDELGQPYAGMQKEGDDDQVAVRLPALVTADCLQQRPFLVLVQIDRWLAVVALYADAGGRIDVNVSGVQQPSEESLDAGTGAVYGRGLLGTTVYLPDNRIAEQEAVEVVVRDAVDMNLPTQMVHQQPQVALVRPDGVRRASG